MWPRCVNYIEIDSVTHICDYVVFTKAVKCHESITNFVFAKAVKCHESLTNFVFTKTVKRHGSITNFVFTQVVKPSRNTCYDKTIIQAHLIHTGGCIMAMVGVW